MDKLKLEIDTEKGIYLLDGKDIGNKAEYVKICISHNKKTADITFCDIEVSLSGKFTTETHNP